LNPESELAKNPLPKSPIKRMKRLEEEQNTEDQEDVETTY